MRLAALLLAPAALVATDGCSTAPYPTTATRVAVAPPTNGVATDVAGVSWYDGCNHWVSLGGGAYGVTAMACVGVPPVHTVKP